MRTKAVILSLAFSAFGFAQQPVISNGGIVNGATFQSGAPIAGGSLISIFGTSLSSQMAAASSIPLSTSLGGVTVTFTNGTTSFDAPMLYVQPDDPANKIATQINAQVPWNLVPAGTSATVSVVVQHDGLASAPAQVQVAPFSPGIISSGGRAVAVNLDGTLAWPAGAVPGVAAHGAKAGDILVVYCTGFGAVDFPIADGANSLDQTRQTITKPIVTINGISAPVQFSGMSPQFVGVNQLNIQVPPVAPGDSLPLQVQFNGTQSPANVTISVIQ